MRTLTVIGVVAIAIGATLAVVPRASTQEKANLAKYEYAVVKWDGPDRIYYNIPGKFELVHLAKTGDAAPKEAQEEEYYLSVAANKMAHDGWEAVGMDSRRILFRRAVRQ